MFISLCEQTSCSVVIKWYINRFSGCLFIKEKGNLFMKKLEVWSQRLFSVFVQMAYTFLTEKPAPLLWQLISFTVLCSRRRTRGWTLVGERSSRLLHSLLAFKKHSPSHAEMGMAWHLKADDKTFFKCSSHLRVLFRCPLLSQLSPHTCYYIHPLSTLYFKKVSTKYFPNPNHLSKHRPGIF